MATTPDFSVAAKHVLITGGTGGIGNAFAEAFLNDGAHVIVADVKAPKDGIDPRIRYEQLDVRDDTAVEALAARVEKLDVVIHCAGRLARWEEYKPEVFKEILDIHLVGSLRLANAFRPHRFGLFVFRFTPIPCIQRSQNRGRFTDQIIGDRIRRRRDPRKCYRTALYQNGNDPRFSRKLGVLRVRKQGPFPDSRWQMGGARRLGRDGHFPCFVGIEVDQRSDDSGRRGIFRELAHSCGNQIGDLLFARWWHSISGRETRD